MKLLCFSLSSIIVKEIYSSLGALVRQNNVSDGMLFPENLYFIFFICFVFLFSFLWKWSAKDKQRSIQPYRCHWRQFGLSTFWKNILIMIRARWNHSCVRLMVLSFELLFRTREQAPMQTPLSHPLWHRNTHSIVHGRTTTHVLPLSINKLVFMSAPLPFLKAP